MRRADDVANIAAMGARTGINAAASPVSKNQDFNAWILEQAQALRMRRYAIDWEGIAEELEAMARKDHTTLRSHVQNLLCQCSSGPVSPVVEAKAGGHR